MINKPVQLIDTVSGIQNKDNLFVPFYTTKPDGQGIGLILCRNIIEQDGGQLTLSNNKEGPGARACIRLPLKAVAAETGTNA